MLQHLRCIEACVQIMAMLLEVPDDGSCSITAIPGCLHQLDLMLKGWQLTCMSM